MTDTRPADNTQYYYIDKHREVIGPMPLSVIRGMVRAGNLSESVLVACEGSASWTPLNALSAKTTLPEVPQKRRIIKRPGPRLTPHASGVNTSFHRPVAAMPKPASHLTLAILVTIFCCLPFGIVAIIRASSVDSLYHAGNYTAAAGASESASTWCLWGIITGILVGVAWFLFGPSHHPYIHFFW